MQFSIKFWPSPLIYILWGVSKALVWPKTGDNKHKTVVTITFETVWTWFKFHCNWVELSAQVEVEVEETGDEVGRLL